MHVRKLRQPERKELSDQRMIETAMQLILRNGVSGLRLTDVGVVAGYSRGLAAMRFGTMGGLLRRVAAKMSQMWTDDLRQQVGGKTGLTAVYAAIDTLEKWLVPLDEHVRIQYLLFFHSIDPGGANRLNVRQVLLAQRADLVLWLRQASDAGHLQAGIDPELEANAILSSIIGIIYQAMVDPDVSPRSMLVKLKRDIETRMAAPGDHT